MVWESLCGNECSVDLDLANVASLKTTVSERSDDSQLHSTSICLGFSATHAHDTALAAEVFLTHQRGLVLQARAYYGRSTGFPLGAATLPGSRNGADGNGPAGLLAPASRVRAPTSSRAPTRGGTAHPAAGRLWTDKRTLT
jgi:hypothetical protein